MSETVSAERLREKVREEIIRSAEILRPEELATTVDGVIELALRQPDTSEGSGWTPVPPKPTDQMYVAFREALDDAGHIYRFVEAYEAMLAAAPPLNKSPNPEHVEGDVLSVGEMEVVAWDRLRELIAEYFDLGYAEGVVQRDADTMAGDAQRTLSEIEAIISSAQSSIQRAEREREIADRNRDAARDNFLTMQGAAAKLLKRATAAEAQLEEARKVLEPFANKATLIPDYHAGDYNPDWSPFIPVGAYRAAHTFLASLREKQDAE